MSVSRSAFLHRVRDAVAAGNRAGSVTAIGPRGQIGYQGAGPDLVARFTAEFATAGGTTHVVPDHESAMAKLKELVGAKAPRRILLGRGPIVDLLSVADRLQSLACAMVSVDALSESSAREALFAADVGISGVEFLVAETGTIVVRASSSEPRSLSLLPPVHLVVAERSQVLADLFDLFERFAPGAKAALELPSCLSLITGPSKTGDIELRLVTGVHGPGEVHVILINS